MQLIHAARPIATGVFLLVSVMVMLGARYASGNEAVSVAVAAFDCSVSCGQDSYLECDPDTEHIAYDGYAVDQPGPHGPHTNCQAELCEWDGGPRSMHPGCLGTLNLVGSGDYARLKAALAAQDDATLQQLMRRYSVVVLNANRGSIQVISCDGLPRANLPVHPQQFERLVNAQ